LIDRSIQRTINQAVPLPRWIARFNRHVTNRLLGPLAPYLPAFGVVVHVGRKSHRVYRTPINVFRRPGGYVIALTYGPDADWVHNVLANDGAILETRGRTLRLTRPRLIHDETRGAVPAFLRPMGALGHVSDFLYLDTDDAAAPSAPSRASKAS
jgi:deazaflavin-dependent oxidoreductase (nitroreductase family)